MGMRRMRINVAGIIVEHLPGRLAVRLKDIAGCRAPPHIFPQAVLIPGERNIRDASAPHRNGDGHIAVGAGAQADTAHIDRLFKRWRAPFFTQHLLRIPQGYAPVGEVAVLHTTLRLRGRGAKKNKYAHDKETTAVLFETILHRSYLCIRMRNSPAPSRGSSARRACVLRRRDPPYRS